VSWARKRPTESTLRGSPGARHTPATSPGQLHGLHPPQRRRGVVMRAPRAVHERDRPRSIELVAQQRGGRRRGSTLRSAIEKSQVGRRPVCRVSLRSIDRTSCLSCRKSPKSPIPNPSRHGLLRVSNGERCGGRSLVC
jgi:hypothetical protein